jgi:hypothetical protein
MEGSHCKAIVYRQIWREGDGKAFIRNVVVIMKLLIFIINKSARYRLTTRETLVFGESLPCSFRDLEFQKRLFRIGRLQSQILSGFSLDRLILYHKASSVHVDSWSIQLAGFHDFPQEY